MTCWRPERRPEYVARVEEAKSLGEEYRAGRGDPRRQDIDPQTAIEFWHPQPEQRDLRARCLRAANGASAQETKYARENSRAPYFGRGTAVEPLDIALYLFGWAQQQIAAGNPEGPYFDFSLFRQGRRWALATASGGTHGRTVETSLKALRAVREVPWDDFLAEANSTRTSGWPLQEDLLNALYPDVDQHGIPKGWGFPDWDFMVREKPFKACYSGRSRAERLRRKSDTSETLNVFKDEPRGLRVTLGEEDEH